CHLPVDDEQNLPKSVESGLESEFVLVEGCIPARGPADSNSDWFSEGIGKKVGNGSLTSFWLDLWFGGTPLRVQHPRLFQVSQQRNSKVQEIGNWENGQWVWDLVWHRELFVWEMGGFYGERPSHISHGANLK
ncbi:TIR-NBS-LRR type disease resistance protein, partial [Trifolium medium]|nr:TIR-NBS-LRR type disease resistance protein [Trifolium medium]